MTTLPKILPSVIMLTLLSPVLRADSPQPNTAKAVAAANAFLSTLDDKQKSAVLFKFDDEKQRARWSNLPVRMVPRAGLRMGDLSDAQRKAAMDLLAATLSPRGFEKIQQIVLADETLRQSQNNPMFGKDNYYISLLGTPSESSPWMLQFGGHHLGLNVTIDNHRGVLTPTHTGAQPALFQSNGKTIRPLGGESDKALALLDSLDESQRKQAVLNYHVADLVLGPGKDGHTIPPEGLKASALNDKQRQMLLDLISEWVNIADDFSASARMADVKSHLEDTYFAWSGPTTADPGKNITAYYRVTGPTLVIEYAPQRLGGDLSLHVHTIYRDPTNDYARKPSPK
jgi:uncharacterized protein DUF3500